MDGQCLTCLLTLMAIWKPIPTSTIYWQLLRASDSRRYVQKREEAASATAEETSCCRASELPRSPPSHKARIRPPASACPCHMQRWLRCTPPGFASGSQPHFTRVLPANKPKKLRAVFQGGELGNGIRYPASSGRGTKGGSCVGLCFGGQQTRRDRFE